MADERFRPFGMTDDEYEELLVLRDGVPPGLREPLIDWVYHALTASFEYSTGRYLLDDKANVLRGLTGVDLGQRAGTTINGARVLQVLNGLSELSLLRLTDALIYAGERNVSTVERYLALNSSKYEVGMIDGAQRLVPRLAEGVQDQIEHLVHMSRKPGALLHRAFTAAYGLQPNAGEAYKMSVKAVETAAHLVIEPRNSGATLGTMLAVMRTARTNGNGWSLRLTERGDHTGANVDLLIGLMQTLWDGQEDRHRDGAVDLDEAKTAFHAATTIVAWFTEGLVAR